MDDARALLNSLMGNDRNAKESERVTRKFTDSDICKNYLMGLCPHDLFPNTKIDLGCCDKEHHEPSRDAFESDAEAVKYKRKWRGSLRNQLRRLLEGVDRRVGQNQRRIAMEKEGGLQGASLEQKQKLADLKEEVSNKLKEAEQMGDDGKFEDSRNLIKDTEATKRQIEDLEQKRYEKYSKEDICGICGLIIDFEEQEAMKTGRGWHINGKQHIGYGLIRDKLKDIEDNQEQDKKDGIRSPTPSPVKEVPRETKRRKASKSPIPARGQKTEGKGRKSRSPSRGKKLSRSEVESRRRKASRSRSRRRKEKSRSRSHAKPKKSDDKRSRSRKKKSRSRSKKARSRSKKKTGKSAKDPSPKKKSPSRTKDKEKEKKKKGSKHEDSTRADPTASMLMGNADAASKAKASVPADEEDLGARNRAAPVFMVFGKKVGEAPKATDEPLPEPQEAAPPAPAPAPPPEAPAPAPEPTPEPKAPPKEEDQGARNRAAPVFMVFGKRK